MSEAFSFFGPLSCFQLANVQTSKIYAGPSVFGLIEEFRAISMRHPNSSVWFWDKKQERLPKIVKKDAV
jgi:hypothetical protein